MEKNKYDKAHKRNIARYGRKIDAIYKEAIREAVAISGMVSSVKDDAIFSFDNYPVTRKRVNRMLQNLRENVLSAIVNGIQTEWTLANNKNNEVANMVFGKRVNQLTEAQRRRYYSNNEAARDAFVKRKENGLSLSDRVWQYTDQFKEEIEMSLDIGIREGQSAAQMSRNVRQYLNKPNMLFRRVRDEHGELQLSKRAKAYHPGQGVYRSSYKNARRLTATETNIAYRTADHLRYQKMDFVVGIEIHLSGNHTLNGKPFHDICDELAGKYPKDFKFTGWHPQCRCFVTSILKTKEEREEDVKKILRGEPVNGESVNKVKDVPQQFKTWLKDNELRALNRFSVPYFMTENAGGYVPLRYITAYASKNPYDTFAEYEQAREYNKKHADFSDEQKENIRELNKVMPVVQGQVMNFGQADHHSCNPHFRDSDAVEQGYYHNCQTCTVAYELRRRGFMVEAMPNPISRNSKGIPYYYTDGRVVRDVEWMFMAPKPYMPYSERFLNEDGSPATYEADSTNDVSCKDTKEWKSDFILNNCYKEGRYEVECSWKGGDGHVFIIERDSKGNITWYDPQSGIVEDRKRERKERFKERYLDNMKPDGIKILRIDNKLINPKFAKRFLRSN